MCIDGGPLIGRFSHASVEFEYGIITLTPARDTFVGHTTEMVMTGVPIEMDRNTTVRLGDVGRGRGVFVSAFQVIYSLN